MYKVINIKLLLLGA